MSAFIQWVGTAVPKFRTTQSEIANYMKSSIPFDDRAAHELDVLYRASGIRERHLPRRELALRPQEPCAAPGRERELPGPVAVGEPDRLHVGEPSPCRRRRTAPTRDGAAKRGHEKGRLDREDSIQPPCFLL